MQPSKSIIVIVSLVAIVAIFALVVLENNVEHYSSASRDITGQAIKSVDIEVSDQSGVLLFIQVRDDSAPTISSIINNEPLPKVDEVSE